jgi:hypothetical protein
VLVRGALVRQSHVSLFFRRLPSILLMIFAGCLSMPSLADNTCSPDGPPPDAAVSANHGSFFFVYPRAVSRSYSGCQTMWDELGRKIFVFRFTEGVLQEYSLMDYSGAGGSKPMVCKYAKKRLGADSPKDCSPYEDAKSGLLNVAPEDEPPVPADRDPRLRRQSK